MLGLYKHHMAPNPICQRGRKRLECLIRGPSQRFWIRPHSLIWTAFNFIHIPNTITNLVSNYFQDLQFCIQTTEYTTSWQSLEVGIMAGCTISPLAFTMAMEVIIRASKWVLGGECLQSGHLLPPIRAYMDDMTILTSTVTCTKHLLGKLQANSSNPVNPVAYPS